MKTETSKTEKLRNVTIFIIVVDGCIIIIHEVVTCNSTLMKQSLSLTT